MSNYYLLRTSVKVLFSLLIAPLFSYCQSLTAAVPIDGVAGSDSRPFVVGWEFSVLSPVTVTGLTYLDATAAGLAESHMVGIFDSGTGALLVSGSVPQGTSTPYQNGFRVFPVNYSLQPGKYVIGGQRTTDADPAIVRAARIATASQIAYIEERELKSDVFTMPATHFDLDEAGSFGPGFLIATNSDAGAVTGVTNSGSFQPSFASGTYVTLFGRNLASTTRVWAKSDFPNGNQLPTSLEGISVTARGTPCFVEYVSPGQINIVLPQMGATGDGVPLTIHAAGKPDITAWIAVRDIAPALFAWQTGTSESGKYVVAQHADYTSVGKAGLFPSQSGVTTTPARSGETIILYGTGFGPPPQYQVNLLADKVYPLPTLPTASIGGVTARVAFAGVIPPLAGIYQFNVVLPPNLPSGDLPFTMTLNGVTTYSSLITVQ